MRAARHPPRELVLAESYPGAFTATIPTDPILVAGANAFALQSTGARTKLVASSYTAVWWDEPRESAGVIGCGS